MQHTCRCLSSPSTPLWTSGLLVKPGTIEQVIRRYDIAAASEGSPRRGLATRSSVRCVVAARTIIRGERLCVVPPSHLITGDSAAKFIHTVCRATERLPTSLKGLPTYREIVQRLHEMNGGQQHLLATRDGLLLTMALYLLRSPCYRSFVPVDHVFSLWAACLPPSVPPLGVLLHHHYAAKGVFAPLQRRLRLEDRTVPLLPDGSDANSQATELLLAAVDEKGLDSVGTPHVEVALTEEMCTAFYKGQRFPLTKRQHESVAAHSRREGGSEAVSFLRTLMTGEETQVLRPIFTTLQPELSLTDDSTAVVAERSALQWAHFMARSRVMNLRWRQEVSQSAIIPFLDMLNHSHRPANVVYHLRPDDGSVIVSAARRIGRGEELTLHYGNRGQRGCLFGEGYGLVQGPGGSSQGEQEVRRAEALQRREMLNDTTSVEEMELYNTSQHESRQSSIHNAREEAQREARWLWRYGFCRSEEERAHEASKLWSAGLRQRIAHLTDVRRKGRPGEFVVGVPEGLNHLRAQRDQLERERYRRANVFPPQCS